MIENLQEWIVKLEQVSDDSLLNELGSESITIDEDKFAQAFSAFAFSEALARLEISAIHSTMPSWRDIPENEIERNRWRAAFIFRVYTTFVYMRSETLERGLDGVGENSPIRPFRDFFRTPKKKDLTDTVARHIRNSICHGTFTISEDFKTVKFVDHPTSKEQWEASIDAKAVYSQLCEQVKRFYLRAYEVKYPIGTSS